jgi:hypothetical protein
LHWEEFGLILKQNSSILFQVRSDPGPVFSRISAMKSSNPPKKDRVAFSPAEFAALFGRSGTWGYRQLYSGSVNAIKDHGRLMIPASEVERVLGTAGVYNGLKPKVTRKDSNCSGWQKFLERRRHPKPSNGGGNQVAESKGKIADDPRDAAIARLRRKRSFDGIHT